MELIPLDMPPAERRLICHSSPRVLAMTLEHVRHAETPYRFDIPTSLFPVLRDLQVRDAEMGYVSDLGDVVVLYLGLGPAAFLALDGRVIAMEAEDPSELYEVIGEREACFAIVEGAQTRGVPELCRLLPSRPLQASDCPTCKGEGHRWSPDRACYVCGGLGWLRDLKLAD